MSKVTFKVEITYVCEDSLRSNHEASTVTSAHIFRSPNLKLGNLAGFKVLFIFMLQKPAMNIFELVCHGTVWIPLGPP